MSARAKTDWAPGGYYTQAAPAPRKFSRIAVKFTQQTRDEPGDDGSRAGQHASAPDAEEPGDDGSRAGQHASAPDAEGVAEGPAASSSQLSPRSRGILAVICFLAWCVVLDAAVLFMSF